MGKRLGVTKLGIALFIFFFIAVLFFTPFNVFSSPGVNGSATLNKESYGFADMGLITVSDNDTTANPNATLYNTINITLNSSGSGTNIPITLNETGPNTGVFNGTFNFTITGNSSGSTLRVNTTDTIWLTYNDTDIAPNGTLLFYDSANFTYALTGRFSFNGTKINSTDTFNINTSALVWIEDNDSFSNINASVSDTFNVTVSNSSGCSFNLTFNETSANSGNFTATMVFGTACNASANTVQATPGQHVYINFTYTDPRNGSAVANVPVSNQTLADNMPPSFISVKSLDSDTIYAIGERISINITLDQAQTSNINITGNFSPVDVNFGGLNNATIASLGGSYNLSFAIGGNPNRQSGNKSINITAFDAVGNGPSYTTFNITLSLVTANTTLLNFGNLTPGGNATVLLYVNNSYTSNETSVVQNLQIYRRSNFEFTTSSNETRNFYFVAPLNTSSIFYNVTANISSAGLSVVLYDYQNSIRSSLNSTTISSPVSSGHQTWRLFINITNVSEPARVTPLVDVYLNSSYWITSNSPVNLSNGSATIISLNSTPPGLDILPSAYNGSIIYSNENFSLTIPFALNISGPQLWIETNISSPISFLPNDTVTYSSNLRRDIQIVRLFINNTGNTNLTSITVNITSNFTGSGGSINITNVTGGSGINTSNLQGITFPDLASNSSNHINISFNTSHSSASGIYPASIIINTSNGLPVRTANLTLRINLTSLFNVTVTSITPSEPLPSQNLTFNVSVRYLDGGFATGLNISNFTVFDRTQTGNVYSGTSILAFSDSQNSSGYYQFNITTPGYSSGTAQPGTHNLAVQASDNFGNSNNGTTSYRLIVGNLVVTPSGSTSISLNQNSSTTKDFIIDNTGTTNLTNADVNATASGISGLTVSGDRKINLTAGGSATVTFTIQSGNTAGNGTVTVNASQGSLYSVASISVGVAESTSSTTTPAGPGGQQTPNRTRVSKLEIIEHESSLTATLGTILTTTARVNNTGETTLTVKMAVVIGNNISTSVLPTSCSLVPSANCRFNLTLNIPETSGLGDITGTFKAFQADNENVVVNEKPFTLTIQPSEEKIQEINRTYSNFSLEFDELINILKNMESAGNYSEGDIEKIRQLINLSNQTILKIKSALEAGDFILADTLSKDLEISLERIRESIVNAAGVGIAPSEQTEETAWVWTAVGIVVVFLLSFLIYVFWPERGYGYIAKSEKSLRPKVKRPETQSEIKSVMQKDYQRLKKFPYKYESRKGIGGRVKDFFRRKKPPQMSISEFFGE